MLDPSPSPGKPGKPGLLFFFIINKIIKKKITGLGQASPGLGRRGVGRNLKKKKE